MKEKLLDASYLSAFCMELYLTTRAGIPFAEGVRLLQEEEQDNEYGQILKKLYQQLENGEPFAVALQAAGGFPVYVVEMVGIGERTGHLEAVFRALANYYDRMDQLKKSLRNAIVYPSVLLVMMLMVILILLVKVLPIFQTVFDQLGAELSPMAQVLLQVGGILGTYGLWVIAAVAVALLIGAVLLRNPERKQMVQEKCMAFLERKKVGRQLASSRIADAMEMALSSGLDVDEALDMASRLVPGAYTREKIQLCKREMLLNQQSFAEASLQAGLFSPMHSRMLAAGFRAGAVDEAMHEVARRCADELDDTVEGLLNKIEPTLVIVLSGAVGVILLSVMLPLMSIMSAIG